MQSDGEERRWIREKGTGLIFSFPPLPKNRAAAAIAAEFDSTSRRDVEAMTTSGGGGSRSPTSQLHAGAAAAQTVAARLLQPIDRKRGEAEVASRGDLLMCFIIVGVTVQLRVDDETFNASARTTPAPPAEAATPVLAASIAAACYIEGDDKMSSARVSEVRATGDLMCPADTRCHPRQHR